MIFGVLLMPKIYSLIHKCIKNVTKFWDKIWFFGTVCHLSCKKIATIDSIPPVQIPARRCRFLNSRIRIALTSKGVRETLIKIKIDMDVQQWEFMRLRLKRPKATCGVIWARVGNYRHNKRGKLSVFNKKLTSSTEHNKPIFLTFWPR